MNISEKFQKGTAYMKKITVHQDVYEMELVLLLIELMCYFGIGNCKRVLGWPTEYSH
jgi:hypothetical protein